MASLEELKAEQERRKAQSSVDKKNPPGMPAAGSGAGVKGGGTGGSGTGAKTAGTGAVAEGRAAPATTNINKTNPPDKPKEDTSDTKMTKESQVTAAKTGPSTTVKK